MNESTSETEGNIIQAEFKQFRPQPEDWNPKDLGIEIVNGELPEYNKREIAKILAKHFVKIKKMGKLGKA
jgi:hypothetical protein